MRAKSNTFISSKVSKVQIKPGVGGQWVSSCLHGKGFQIFIFTSSCCQMTEHKKRCWLSGWTNGKRVFHSSGALFSWHPTKKWNLLLKILKSICIRRTGTKSWFLRWALQLKTLNKKCFKNGGNAFKCFCFLSAHNRVKLRAWNINESRSENQVWRLIKERGLCNIQKIIF